MELSRISRTIGDLKARNALKGLEGSSKLNKCVKQENNLKDKLKRETMKLDKQKLEIGGAYIKEVYVIFEMPLNKKQLIESQLEAGEFISKVKDPKRKRFM